MKPAVVLTEQAQRDILAASQWYEDRREGLGEKFQACARETVGRIQINPEGYALAFRDLRRAPIRRFRDWALFFRMSRVI